MIRSEGTPPAARNIAGSVVTSNSSTILGFVSPTYAAITSRDVTAGPMACDTVAVPAGGVTTSSCQSPGGPNAL